MRHKFLGAPVAAFCIVLTASCGNQSSSTATQSSSTATQSSSNAAGGTPSSAKGQLKTINYLSPLPGVPLWDFLGKCFNKAATSAGLQYKTTGPSGGNLDIQALTNALSQMVATKQQAIALWSVGGAATWDPLIKKVRDQGGVVATLFSGVATKNQNFDIGFNWQQWARSEVQFAAARGGEQHLGVIGQKQTGPGYADYVTALKDEVSKHHNVTLEDLQFDNGTFSDDVTIAKTMLRAHLAINLLVNYNGFPGVPTAIKESGLKGKVFAIVANEDIKQTQGYINDGTVVGVHVNDMCGTATKTVSMLQQAYTGKTVTPNVTSPDKIATPKEFASLPAGWY